MATLTEIETSWSLDDIDRANAIIDAKIYSENRISNLERKRIKATQK